jgi:uncharacterized protein with GYD domain
MPLYLSLMRFTPKALAALADSPDRVAVWRRRVEALSGRSLAFWLTMGLYDCVQLFEMPDDVAMMQYVLRARADGFVEPLIMRAFDGGEYAAILAAATAPEPSPPTDRS